MLRQLGTEAGARCVTFHKWQEAGLLSFDCKCQGQKQEKKSKVGDIPIGQAGSRLFRLIGGGGRSVLEVISIIRMVSVRSLTPPHNSWTPVGDRDPRLRKSARTESLSKLSPTESYSLWQGKKKERLGTFPVRVMPSTLSALDEYYIAKVTSYHIKNVFRTQVSLAEPAPCDSH